MAEAIRLVSGDHLPLIRLTLTDDADDSAIDLSGADTTIVVKFRSAANFTALDTITCAKVSGGSTGQVQFDFSGGALADLDPGEYLGDIVIDFDGSQQTVFDTLRFRVRQAAA